MLRKFLIANRVAVARRGAFDRLGEQLIALCRDPLEAVDGAQALIVETPWPEFRAIEASETARRMAGQLVLDANRFLVATLGRQPGLRYLSVGSAAS